MTEELLRQPGYFFYLFPPNPLSLSSTLFVVDTLNFQPASIPSIHIHHG